MSVTNRAWTAVRQQTVAESPLRSAPLLRTAPPTLLLCWRARYSSRCTPSRCRQRGSYFSCSTPASHPATCSARAGCRTFTPPWALSPARSSVFRLRRAPKARRSPASYFAASWWCCAGLGPTSPRAHAPRLHTFSADSRDLAQSMSTLIPQGS